MSCSLPTNIKAEGSEKQAFSGFSPCSQDGFIAAAAAPRKALGRVVNLGSGREISVGDLVRLIAGMMNRNIKLSSERRRLRPGQSEVERLLPDGGLARSLLGWQPAISLEDGLRRTIAWFAENGAHYRSGDYAL